MKKYVFSLISLAISFGCIGAFAIIGSEIDANGFVKEPFFLIPIAWLFVLIAVVSALVIKFSPFFYKSKKIK